MFYYKGKYSCGHLHFPDRLPDRNMGRKQGVFIVISIFQFPYLFVSRNGKPNIVLSYPFKWVPGHTGCCFVKLLHTFAI